jgi:hypothetical protein
MPRATDASFDLLPGADDSPVILHVPHGAREMPADVREGILLDDTAAGVRWRRS